MSESALSHPMDAMEGSPQQNAFDYRPVPVTAPVTLFIGLASLAGLVSVVGLGICVFGIILGAACLMKIRRSRGELSGKVPAAIGFALSMIFFVSGSCLHAYTFATEVPEGYRRVNFYRDISSKGLIIKNGQKTIHPEVIGLVDENIFIKGYMYPTRQTEGISNFILVKDSDQCCFGGRPDLNDMIFVKMKDGMTIDYRPGLVSIAGGFQLRQSVGPGALEPLFQLDGTFFDVARSSF